MVSRCCRKFKERISFDMISLLSAVATFQSCCLVEFTLAISQKIGSLVSFQGYWAKSLSTKSSLQSDMKLNVKMESSANVCGTE